MTRIGFADHLFLRMHHGIGVPVFNQFLWWFDNAVSVDELELLQRNLTKGLLSRRVAAPLVPTARHRWTASSLALPLDVSPVAIAPDAVRHWADGRVVDDIDPERGTGWQLSAASVDGGGMVVSLVCSHMLADGAAMVAAIRRANSDEPAVGADDLGTIPSVLGGIVDDLSDSLAQLVPIASWGSKKLAAALTGRKAKVVPARGESPHRSDVEVASAPWTPPYVVVECPAEEWHSAAAEWGGTSNSLLIGILTAVSEASGRARPGDEIRWSLPVSERDLADTSANSTKIVPVVVPVTEADDRDLTRIRKASKTAFTEFAARQASGITTEAIPLPLIQMLPDAVVRRVPRPADGAEGLCSNLGVLPDDFTTIGATRARSVAARATFRGADADFARSLGGGSTAWASETDSTVTITVHGMDPDRMATDETMRGIVADVLQRWNISSRFW
ncbi:hypothetical protein [Rhodococcoides yunnanense]|uniref:hypothetical protein n=1 Tax=Rhodococcoides yunnanense TaxID=278209 RepID=UPI000AF82E11|nr:hypothetical protein [Rhodococcus yunnanensis]